MKTGFFGSPHRVTKVHIVENGKPICGCRIAIDLDFQWCAHGVVEEYLTHRGDGCQKCLKRWEKIKNALDETQ